MNERVFLTAVLVVMGAGWGLCVPLGKIAVSGGYRPFGLVFWESLIVTVFLGAVCLIRRRPLRLTRAVFLVFLAVAFLGTLGPGGAYYGAAQHLPGGVLSILMSTVPMLAFPMALALGNDSLSRLRLIGLFFGLLGVGLLIGPEASLPDAGMAAWVPLALIAPLCYAAEGNVVARWGTAGLDPIQVVAGASLLSTLLCLPLALITGQWITPELPFGLPDLALAASAIIHAIVYAIYVWLVGRAGSVFTAQTSYLVTGFGVLWSIWLLTESYSPYIWAALGMMLAGLFLVQPRPRIGLAPVRAMRDSGPEQHRDENA